MDTKLRLAISTRLNQIYGTPPEAEKFLSFPRESMFVFSPQDLELMTKKDADETTRSYYTKSELSRMVNLPVRDIFYDNHGAEEVLWDIYGEVLTTAEVAISRNKADEDDFKKAEKALYTTDEDGLPVMSERYKKYCELRDKRYKAEEERKNLIEEGAGPEDLAKVDLTLENIKRDMAAGDLERFIVEMETIRERVTRNSPAMVWNELRKKYNPDAYFEETLELIDYLPTYITPADVLQQDWDTITLSKADIDTLVQAAPPRLRDAFPPTSGDSVEGVSFEYRSVKLERPWFESELFKSRYWRFASNTGQSALAYAGHNGSAGRFPAYITALILLRNIKSPSGEIMLEEGKVMTMAYICKWLPACPDPDPAAEWGTEIPSAMFILDNSSIGGSVTARVGNNIISSGPCDIGTKIKLTATASSNHFLSCWQVNDKSIDAGNGQIELTMTQAGLKVIPIWEVAMEKANMDIKVNGTTLISISGGPNDLDMNAYKELCNIETIDNNAFANYTNLQRIKIGARVGSIGRNAFSQCKKLINVTIPNATRSIANNAFHHDTNDTVFKVDDDNPVYIALNDMLIERRRTELLPTIRCNCGATWYYKGTIPERCPKCGATFSIETAPETLIQKPDKVIPFKFNSLVAVQRVNSFLKKKWFVDPAFRSAVADNGIWYQKVNIPLWEWNIQGSGTFDIEVKTEIKGKDAAGKETTTYKTEMVKEEASLPDEHIVIPASNLVKDKKLGIYDKEKQEFDPKPDELFEVTACNCKQSLSSAQSKFNDKLREKAKSQINTQGVAVKTVRHENIEYISEASTLTTLPYWMGTINYLNKKYTFLVNDHNGNVTACNGFPKSKKKIWRTIGISVAAVAAIVLLIFMLTSRKGATERQQPENTKDKQEQTDTRNATQTDATGNKSNPETSQQNGDNASTNVSTGQQQPQKSSSQQQRIKKRLSQEDLSQVKKKVISKQEKIPTKKTVHLKNKRKSGDN